MCERVCVRMRVRMRLCVCVHVRMRIPVHACVRVRAMCWLWGCRPMGGPADQAGQADRPTDRPVDRPTGRLPDRPPGNGVRGSWPNSQRPGIAYLDWRRHEQHSPLIARS